MDVMKLTRELGAAIQQDERYLEFSRIRNENESDPQLRDMMGKIQLLQMNYQRESSLENPNSEKLAAYESEFNEAYEKFMNNEKMQAFEAARLRIDEMMNRIMQILGLCVNGADPATCEPEHNCSGSCSECAGGCGGR